VLKKRVHFITYVNILSKGEWEEEEETRRIGQEDLQYMQTLQTLLTGGVEWQNPWPILECL
jgi:hypothetical protein